MGFVLETGTGVVGANAGVSVAYVDTYCSDRGLAGWAGDNSAKQGWIILATDYVEQRFRARLPGEKMVATQGLHFPAVDGEPYVVDGEMPKAYQDALCEYALRAKSAPLAPDPVYDSSGFATVLTSKKIGPLEKHWQVMGNSSSASLIRPYPKADMIISAILLPSGANRVIR